MSYPQHQGSNFQQGHQPSGSVGYEYYDSRATGRPEYNPYSDYNNVNAGYGQGPAQAYRDDYDDGRPGMSTMPSQATAVAGDVGESEKPRRVAPLGADGIGGRTRFSGASFIPPK